MESKISNEMKSPNFAEKLQMRKLLTSLLVGVFFLFLSPGAAQAQCSICTKTAQQLGEKPAKALNGGILYLAAFPLTVAGFIGYKWWKHNR